MRSIGIDRGLKQSFAHLKDSPRVVYPMETQMRMLLDAFVVGETRVFGLESLAADPLFIALAGGRIPSLDTVYDDLDRFGDEDVAALEEMVAEQGLWGLQELRAQYVYLDLDTSVCPHDGEMEGALPGPNPRYRGRPSHHPMMARISETDTLVGMQLRPGNTGLGADDVPTIRAWVGRAQRALRKGANLCVRIDSGADCAEILEAIHAEEAFFIVKGKVSPDMYAALCAETRWKTVDRDADGRPSRQVAELDFQRQTWRDRGLRVRVIAVRSVERHGKQLPLPDSLDVDWTVQVFLTNRIESPSDVAWDYDRRAGIEPLIAELKGAWGIGHASTQGFRANHVVLLLKALAHNLLSRYARAKAPEVGGWRTPWKRRLLIRTPGRISRSGRRRRIHISPGSPLNQILLE